MTHSLPPAPGFVGREAELAALRGMWADGFRGVCALVGLGGAGKTALAARFLNGLMGPDGSPRPAGLFVWSFYQEPDAGLFLHQLHDYFAGAAGPTPARGAGLLHLLRDVLAVGGPHLLVLDGLERVQCQEGQYGQVEDPLLRGLLTRAAEGLGRTAVLVTSRFPLTDLEPFRQQGYRQLDVGGLNRQAACDLLRQRGVKGDDDALRELVESYGAHALTLDHLGGLIGQFLEGDPSRAPEAPALAAPGQDRQALRLARLLWAYEVHLPPAELALLCRLCLLRRSVTAEQIEQLFLCEPAVHARTARELGELIALLYVGGKKPEERRTDALDLGKAVREAVEEALTAGPIAGPEEAFRQEARQVGEAIAELYEREIDVDIVELATLYSPKDLDFPTDLRPLSSQDRVALRALVVRYLELIRHPFNPTKSYNPVLQKAFLQLGLVDLLFSHGPKGRRRTPDDLGPADVRRQLEGILRRLRHLVFKHFALRRVRELCRLYRRKSELAGALAPLDAPALHRVLDALAGRHLVLKEADGSFSVHPAVRDYFTRRAEAEGDWHDLIREQLVSLVQRPGRHLPEDRVSLDLMEEAIYHAREAGRVEEAFALFDRGMGGLRHLGWKLGEMGRGLRILRGFDPCPDRWALAWFLRALGQMEEAYSLNDLAYFRADVRLLQGRLPEVAAEGDDVRTAAAEFLMGRTRELPADVLGCAVPRDQLLLYLGRLRRGPRSASLEPFFHDIGWEADRARCQLLLAEAARRESDPAACRAYLESASRWILHSGSVEHLCLYHLLRARAPRPGDAEAARRALDEGLHLARQCGLRLYHIELLCERAALSLACKDAAAAERDARDALGRATAAGCQFAWGEAEAGQVLGQALAALQHRRGARDVLDATLELRQRIGHPGTEQTLLLIAQLSG